MPLTDARDNFSRLVADVENITDGLYVLTKGGKPAIALINIKYLEEIMAGRASTKDSLPNELTAAPKPKPAPLPDLPKPFVAPPPVTPKIAEPTTPAPIKDENFFKPANLPTPSFEPPKVSDSNEPPKTNSLPGSVTPPSSNYDVKPTVNPSWTGEPVKTEPTPASPSSVTGANTAPINLTSSVPSTPPKPFEPTPAKPFNDASAKPTVSPWPIIPPRTEPPKPAAPAPMPSASPVSPAVSPTATLNTAPTLEINKPASSPSAPAPKPEDSFPKMGTPPPSPPPSPLPNIPSSFVAVPVPINGNKPTAPLPPPPKIDAPAPFSAPTPPAPVTPKPAEPIQFDAPPTIVPDPGEEMLPKSATKDDTSAIKSDNSTETNTPPQSQSSVQDLEI